jgi:hypothetical protein
MTHAWPDGDQAGTMKFQLISHLCDSLRTDHLQSAATAFELSFDRQRRVK